MFVITTHDNKNIEAATQEEALEAMANSLRPWMQAGDFRCYVVRDNGDVMMWVEDNDHNVTDAQALAIKVDA